MKTETLLFLIAIFAILAMAAVLALALLYPNGVLWSEGLKHITVTASGTSYGNPQVATIYVMMNGTGATAAIATSNLSLTLNEFNYTMQKYIGNNSSRIATQSYSLQHIWNRSGYVATEMASVYIPQVSDVSSIISTLSLIQNIYVNQITAQLSGEQIGQLTGSALSLAIQNATAQAQTAAGNSTIMIKNITVSKVYVYPYLTYTNAAYLAAPTSQLFFEGRQGVQEQVNIVFEYR